MINWLKIKIRRYMTDWPDPAIDPKEEPSHEGAEEPQDESE